MNEDMQFISQPLITEQGFLNPAAVSELTATIQQTPKTYERLRGDPEWDVAKNHWTTRKDIVGAFAMWSCRQSPYGVPDGLENVCKFLYAALGTCCKWDMNGMAEVSLCDINRWLHEILYDQGVTQFDAWNRCKSGPTPDIAFSSRFDGEPDPDRDFIDLDALLRNVCIAIRDERRINKAFDEKFELENGKLTTP